MLTLDLSTLRGPELRRLLDTTRQRGQAKLSYEILQEMAARRERDEGRRTFERRPPRTPHEISLDLGDPLERLDDDEPGHGGAVFEEEHFEARRPEAQHFETEHFEDEAHHDEPYDDDYAPNEHLETAAVEPDEPIYLNPDREGRGPTRNPPPPPARGRGVSRRWLWVTVGVAIGLFVGLAVGGWADGVSRQPAMPKSKAPDQTEVAAATPAPSAVAAALEPPVSNPSAPIVDDSITPQAAPQAAAPAAPVAAPATAAPAVTPPSSVSIAVAKPSVPATPAKPSAPPPAAEPKLAAKAKAPPVPAGAEQDATMASIEADLAKPAKETSKPTKLASAAAAAEGAPAPAAAKGACASQPTPADRTICETPRLQRLQKDLRTAYADALDAHQDRDLLREHQLAWRDQRSTVTDPDRLARLYEERIRKLNAAADEARAER